MKKKMKLKYMFFAQRGDHAFYVEKTGKMFGFGGNYNGQLGLGDIIDRPNYTFVNFFDNVEIYNVCLGWANSCFRTGIGVLSCGSGSGGKLSLGDTENRTSPEEVELEDNDVDITEIFSTNSSLFFLCSGVVYCAGYNARGTLCLGDTNDRLIGTKNPHLKEKVKHIVTGYVDVYFLCESGKWMCGGHNRYGALGIGHDKKQLIPVEFSFFKERGIAITSIEIGTNGHSTFFLCDDKVYVCGNNTNGEYSAGSFTANTTFLPVLSKSIKNVDAISVTNGSVVWISNNKLFRSGGSICSTSSPPVNTPTQIGLPSGCIGKGSIYLTGTSSGGKSLLFVEEGGQSLYGYGSNRYGRIPSPGMAKLTRITLLNRNLNLKRFPLLESEESTFAYDLTNERVNFVLSLPSDLDVHFNDTTVKVFSSIINPESSLYRRIKDGRVQVNRDLQTTFQDSEIIHSLFWGVEVEDLLSENLKNYLDLYLFFNATGMRRWEFALLKKVSRIESLKSLVILFRIGFRMLEKQLLSSREDDFNSDDILENHSEISFESNFCLNLFNTLAVRGVKEIQKNRAILKALERLNVWGDLVGHRVRRIENLVAYDGLSETSFPALFQEHCNVLFRHRSKTSNYIIVSVDEKEIPVHKEVVCLSSDYFHKVVKFGGRETRKEGYLFLERLNYEELMVIVEFIYTREVCPSESVEHLNTLMKVLEEIIPYDEDPLQTALTKTILEITNSLIGKGTFLGVGLMRIGHFFSTTNRTLPEDVKKSFVKIWKKKVEKRTLKEFFERSAQKRIRRKNEEENRGLKERVDTIEKSVVGLSSDVDSLQTDVAEVKKSVSEILEILKASGKGESGRKRKTGGDGGEMGKEEKKRKHK